MTLQLRIGALHRLPYALSNLLNDLSSRLHLLHQPDSRSRPDGRPAFPAFSKAPIVRLGCFVVLLSDLLDFNAPLVFMEALHNDCAAVVSHGPDVRATEVVKEL